MKPVVLIVTLCVSFGLLKHAAGSIYGLPAFDAVQIDNLLGNDASVVVAPSVDGSYYLNASMAGLSYSINPDTKTLALSQVALQLDPVTSLVDDLFHTQDKQQQQPAGKHISCCLLRHERSAGQAYESLPDQRKCLQPVFPGCGQTLRNPTLKLCQTCNSSSIFSLCRERHSRQHHHSCGGRAAALAVNLCQQRCGPGQQLFHRQLHCSELRQRQAHCLGCTYTLHHSEQYRVRSSISIGSVSSLESRHRCAPIEKL